ncbi:putative centrosomal protein [Chloropicon primus]|uniref:Putative centrosomal protein n=1 Tax=Chloropicon primus TaxID=1764295 RepID=A0A5B8MRR5_9CHLO|nr:putative centrosomal protein [Chloropicon primus]UPR02379.1 putative centrosomal protein [Chloropicon primus]|eukprot:QDZ23166.1 putative centrosomal protein [Chloropicon primus]
MLPESFPARGEHLSQQWQVFEGLDLASFEPGKTLTSAVVAELTSGAKQLVQMHIEEDVTVSAEENLKRVLKVAKILQYAFELEQYQAEEIEQDLERKVDTLAQDLQEAEHDCETLRLQIERNNEEDVATTNQKIELVLNELEEERVKNDRMEREAKQLEKQLDLERQNTQAAETARQQASERNTELEDRIRVAEEDVAELRSHLATEQKRAVVRGDDDKTLNSRLIKYTREIDRLQRENNTLAEANAEIQSKNEQCQGEIIGLSESLLAMDQSNSDRANTISTLEDSYRELELERDNMSMRISELEGSVEEKMALLEEFEKRFKSQYENWVEERKKLSSHAMERQVSQLQRIEKSLSDPTATVTERSQMIADKEASVDARGAPVPPQDEAELQQKYVESQEKVVLLLEAYEQLEKDTAREVDHALQIQKSKQDRMKTELKIKEEALDIERERFQQLDQALAECQQQLEEAELRNKDYEAGVYGLPEAVTEIKQLKQEKRTMGVKLNDALRKLSGISLEAEGMLEENALLRQKLGLPPDEKLVTKDFRLQSQVTVAQLRAINSQLQREILELEEDRRKMKMEMRFRAKWQGEHALHMGLSPNQLLLLEEYADSLRYGGGTAAPESKILSDMERQVQVLEERLALAQVSASHPDAASSLLALSGGAESLHRESLVNQNLQGVVASLRERNDELSREAQHFQINISKLLKELEASADQMAGDSLDASIYIQEKLTQILSAVADGTMDAAGAASAVASSATRQADARVASIEKELELKSAELESRNLVIESLQREMSKLKEEARSAARQEQQPMEAMSPPSPSKTAEEDFDISSSAVVMQLAQCMNIQGKHEDETKQLVGELQRHKNKLESFVDQRAILYRQYFAAEQKWKKEGEQLRARIDTLESENAEQKVRMIEIDKLNLVLQSNNESEMKQELRKIVGKGAVLQVKNMRLARRLDVLSGAERSLKKEKTQLLEDIQQLSTSYRAEIRQLEYSKRVNEVAIQRLYREVETSVPSRLFEEVLAQKVTLQESLRELVELNATDAIQKVNAAEKEREILGLKNELEEARRRETHESEKRKESEKLVEALNKDGAEAYNNELREEVVNLRTSVSNAKRREEMNESSRKRFEATEEELRSSVKELEEALQKHVSLLHTARQAETQLTKKIATMVHRDIHDNLSKRMVEREKELIQLKQDLSTLKDIQASRKEKEERMKDFESAYLQDISSLKEALRNMADSNDQDHVINRLHEELLHLRAKEAAMKMSLARAESRSQRLEKQCEDLNNKVQETMRDLWAERENMKSKFKNQNKLFDRLETELSGRVEFQKAHKWAKTVTQLQKKTQDLDKKLLMKEEREMELQIDLENTKLHLQSTTDIKRLMNEAPSDMHKEVIRVQEEYLQAKMTSSRLQRELDGLKGKASLNEKSAKDSESQLQKVEEEGMRVQLKLKEQIRELQAKEQLLEGNILQLQKEKGEIQASVDNESRNVTKEFSRDTLDSALLKTQVEGGQSIILEQIDKIKDLRQEIVALEQKASQAQKDLEQKEAALQEVEIERDHLLTRIESQLSGMKLKSKENIDDEDFAVQQVKEAAEASVQRLQNIIKEKGIEIKSLRNELELERKRTLEETLKSNKQIQELRLSVEKAKMTTVKTFANPMASGVNQPHPSAKGRYSVLKYEQLIDTLEEKDHNIELLKNQLEQTNSKFEIMQTKLTSEVKIANDNLQRFKLDIEREKARSSTKIMEITISKLKSQLVSKDKRLLHLKEAIKTLEAQLIKVMQVNASQTILESDVNMTVQEQREREKLEGSKERLASRLKKAQEEIKNLKEIIQTKNDMIITIEERHMKGRQEAQSLQALAEESSLTLLAEDIAPVNISDPELMKKRIRVLETKNQRLRVMLQANQTLAATPKKVKPRQTKSSRNVGIATDQGEEEQTPVASKPAGPSEPPSSETKPVVRRVKPEENIEILKWEEGKRLKKQIEVQKAKVGKLQAKLDAAEKDAERHRKIISNLTNDRSRLAAGKAQVQQPQVQQQKPEEPQAPQEKKVVIPKALAEKDAVITELEAKMVSLEEKITKLEDELDSASTENKKLVQRLNDQPSVGLLMQDQASVSEETMQMKLFDTTLERDQALAQVERYRVKLQAYFKDGDAPGGGKASGSSRSANLSKLQAENQDLKNLVAGFERSVAKLKYDKENSVSNQKYMAAVQRIKELKKSSQKMQDEISKMDKKQLQEIKDREGKISELSTAVKDLKKEKEKKREKERECGLLKEKLQEKEVEIEHLHFELEGEKEKIALYLQGKDEPSPKKSVDDAFILELEEDLNNYKMKARELELENTDLRTELNAFDPSFFEEIEDLKHEHFQLTQRCSSYESEIRDLRADLAAQ